MYLFYWTISSWYFRRSVPFGEVFCECADQWEMVEHHFDCIITIRSWVEFGGGHHVETTSSRDVAGCCFPPWTGPRLSGKWCWFRSVFSEWATLRPPPQIKQTVTLYRTCIRFVLAIFGYVLYNFRSFADDLRSQLAPKDLLMHFVSTFFGSPLSIH